MFWFLSIRLLQLGDIASNNNNITLQRLSLSGLISTRANQPGGRVSGELESLLLFYCLYQGIEPENPEHLG